MTRTVRERFTAGDDGFTLAEILVATAIFGLLMIMLGSVTISAMNDFRTISDRNRIQGEQQNAMEALSRNIRYVAVPANGTPAFVQVTPYVVEYYTYSGTDRTAGLPIKTRLRVNDQGLYIDTWMPTSNGAGILPTYPESSKVSRQILYSPVKNTADHRVFEFVTFNDEPITVSESGLSAIQMASLRGVTITLHDVNEPQAVQQTINFVNIL
jgi:prepilin-type N-terminal cleavage/methylation domain-containing protein